MVLKRVDFGRCWESFQTPWNACYVFANVLPSTFWIVPKRFGVNSEGSEIHRFWAKSLGYSPWFWRGSILVGAGNRSKLPEMPAMCLQMYFQVLSGLFLKDLGWIPKVPKSTDFEQKAWAIAHGFEQGRFGKVLGIVTNFLKCLLCACKWISNYFRDCSRRFGVNSEGSEIHRFWPKTLCYSPWFWTGRIWVGAWNCPNFLKCLLCACKWISNYFRDCSRRFGVISEGSEIHRFWPKTLCYSLWFWTGPIWVGAWNCSKLSEMSPMCVEMDFKLLWGMFLKIWSEFRRVRNPPILTKKPWAITHGFEQGRFGLVLGIVPNFLKCLLCACKWSSNYFRDCSWRFWVNSEGSDIHRFLPKPLVYSPWFWTGSI